MKVYLLLAMATLGCAHSAPQTPLLHTLLVLEAHVEGLRVGTPSSVAFTLRNASPSALEFCLVDSGVSIWIKMASGTFRPLIMYGAVTDTACWRRLRLAPGEGTSFQQQVSIPSGWEGTEASVVIGALLRVKWPNEVRYTPEAEGTVRTPEFSVPILR